MKGFAVQGGLRNLFIVKIETDAGIWGLGEGGMSGRERAMEGMLDHCARILIGMDPRRIEHIWQVLYRSWYFEGGNILGAVISAVDLALWDILGKYLTVPVYQLLGGACRERIGCFATPRAELTGAACVEAARAYVDRGWRHVRFLPGMAGSAWKGAGGDVYEPMESVALAAHWLREVRRTVGPEIALAVDFHHRLTVAEAASFCGQVGDLNLWFLEEPIRAENPKAYQQLRTMTPVPFAIGEEFSSKWAFLPFIEAGLLNFGRVDLSNVGGLTEAKKVAGWCEAHYIDMVPHNPLGPVTTAASIHFAASIGNFGRLEYLEHVAGAYPRDLFPEMPELAGDSYPLPTQPGLGVSFDDSAADAHPFAYWEAPRLRRRDGAHTNW